MAVALHEIVERTRPVSLAGEHVLPVVPELAPLLPAGGLRRGSTVVVAGSTSLALAVLAGPSGAGSWCAAVGMASLGLVAAAEAGIDLERLALVPRPAGEWPTVVAALVDAIDVVLVRPPAHLRHGDARRLMARARERGSVLVAVGKWGDGADVRLTVIGQEWEGLGQGHGHLVRRRLDVKVEGRGAAGRGRRTSLWLAAG